MTIVIRSTADPSAVMAAARKQVASLDQSLPVYHMMRMEDAVAAPQLRLRDWKRVGGRRFFRDGTPACRHRHLRIDRIRRQRTPARIGNPDCARRRTSAGRHAFCSRGSPARGDRRWRGRRGLRGREWGRPFSPLRHRSYRRAQLRRSLGCSSLRSHWSRVGFRRDAQRALIRWMRCGAGVEVSPARCLATARRRRDHARHL